ncbi:tripartite motif-containing protein 30A-like isoform X3 [Mastomys coucha]|uniref:tripartite motif-containing protein 30A-like isoform X3 n=1 Tax=Mastomys coucha TaxID=35658 RepID=UPI00126178E7|nr:tripartite motif-containing protein 30A-like isoform X3 [Mastomys coucha]
MASSVLEILKEEITCPICLELLKEPMSADCNHSFCQACIALNYESNRNTEGEANCPVCRIPYSFGNLRHNRHVGNIVERLKEFKFSPEEKQKGNVCAQHEEKLQLFCRKDMMAICWLCERSQEHHGHQTALIEEAGQEYKEKLQAALQKLMENEKKCDEWQDDLQQQRTDWENQIQSDVENVQIEFKGLREIVNSKETEELQKLKKEKGDVMKKLDKSEKELGEQRELVRALISDVEHQLELSTMEMLQNVNYQEVIGNLKLDSTPIKNILEKFLFRWNHSFNSLIVTLRDTHISSGCNFCPDKESDLDTDTATNCPPKKKKKLPSSRFERLAASKSRAHGCPTILGSYHSI